MRCGVRCAEYTPTSDGTAEARSTARASPTTRQSEPEPITSPTSGPPALPLAGDVVIVRYPPARFPARAPGDPVGAQHHLPVGGGVDAEPVGPRRVGEPPGG